MENMVSLLSMAHSIGEAIVMENYCLAEAETETLLEEIRVALRESEDKKEKQNV